MLSSASALRGRAFTVQLLALPTATEAAGASVTEQFRRPVTSESPAPVSALRLGERYDWIPGVADEPIDPTIFDKRSLTGLRRRRIRTWGDLGRLDDAALLEIANVGQLTVARIHMALDSHGSRMRGHAATVTAWRKMAFEREQAAPADFDLVTAAAWTSVATDDLTVPATGRTPRGDPRQRPGGAAQLLATRLLATVFSDGDCGRGRGR